jgi:hypothetical protein
MRNSATSATLIEEDLNMQNHQFGYTVSPSINGTVSHCACRQQSAGQVT